MYDRRLIGSWEGVNRYGNDVTLVIGDDGTFRIIDPRYDFSPPEGGQLKFSTKSNLQFYFDLYFEGELLDKIPCAIYKIEGDQLILCDAKNESYEGVTSIGEFNFVFPTRFGADSYALQRVSSEKDQLPLIADDCGE